MCLWRSVFFCAKSRTTGEARRKARQVEDSYRITKLQQEVLCWLALDDVSSSSQAKLGLAGRQSGAWKAELTGAPWPEQLEAATKNRKEPQDRRHCPFSPPRPLRHEPLTRVFSIAIGQPAGKLVRQGSSIARQPRHAQNNIHNR